MKLILVFLVASIVQARGPFYRFNCQEWQWIFEAREQHRTFEMSCRPSRMCVLSAGNLWIASIPVKEAKRALKEARITSVPVECRK